MTTQNIGSAEHRAEFLDALRRETAENAWKNELHIMRLNDERAVAKAERDRFDRKLKEKGKPASNAEGKDLFNLERMVEGKDREILTVEETLRYNRYLLNDLIPRYERSAEKEEPSAKKE